MALTQKFLEYLIYLFSQISWGIDIVFQNLVVDQISLSSLLVELQWPGTDTLCMKGISVQILEELFSVVQLTDD